MRKQTWKIERNATLFGLTKFNGGGYFFFPNSQSALFLNSVFKKSPFFERTFFQTEMSGKALPCTYVCND